MAEKFLSTRRAKKLKLIFLLTLIFVLGLIVYLPDRLRLRVLQEESQNLEQRISRLEAEIINYEAKIDKLETDSFILEEIARDRLGVAREDEIIVDIEE